MSGPLSTAELLALGDLLTSASNDLTDRGCEDHDRVNLHDVLHGAAESADGRTNLFGALARTMAKTGYRDLKEFQRVDLVIGGAIGDESR